MSIYYIEVEVLLESKIRNKKVVRKERNWIVAPTLDLNSLPFDDRRIKTLRKRCGARDKESLSFGKITKSISL